MFAPLTVAEHLTIASRRPARGPWTRARVLDLLPRLGERLGHRGDQLSGGDQQMLAIARALLGNPRLLLLDEPSDGLAPAIVAQVGEVIREVSAQGMTAVLVKQHLALALSVAQQVALMRKGRIVHHAPARSSPPAPTTAGGCWEWNDGADRFAPFHRLRIFAIGRPLKVKRLPVQLG